MGETNYIIKSKNYEFACNIKKYSRKYIIYYGGSNLCMTLAIETDKMFPFIFLNNVSNQDGCALSGKLMPKTGTIEMIQSCLVFLKKLFHNKKKLKWVVLRDQSKTRDYKYSLTDLYIAKYGETWYQKYFKAKPFDIDKLEVNDKIKDDLKICFDILKKPWNAKDGVFYFKQNTNNKTLIKYSFDHFYSRYIAKHDPIIYKNNVQYDCLEDTESVLAEEAYNQSKTPHEFLMNLEEDLRQYFLNRILKIFKDTFCKMYSEEELDWAIDLKQINHWDDVEYTKTDKLLLQSKQKEFILGDLNFIGISKQPLE